MSQNSDEGTGVNPLVPEDTVITGQVPVFPACRDHKEIQHRDGQPPWCRHCGWNRGTPGAPARQVVKHIEQPDHGLL